MAENIKLMAKEARERIDCEIAQIKSEIGTSFLAVEVSKKKIEILDGYRNLIDKTEAYYLSQL